MLIIMKINAKSPLAQGHAQLLVRRLRQQGSLEMTKTRFTDKWLQSRGLIPAEGRVEFVDGLCPGLHLRVTQHGRRTFSAMFRINGKLTRQTIGPYPIVTLHNARATALELMRNAQAGVGSREHRMREASTTTYAELVEAYTEKHLKPNARSWKNIRACLLQARLHPMLKRRVADITRRDIIAVMDAAVADGKTQAGINQLRCLKMMFNWAVGRDLIDRSPCDGVKSPGRTNERDRILSDGEIAAVWKATTQLPAPYGQMFKFFLLTGQRRSEVATMRRCDIDREIWTIPRERVKKDRPHTVPLTKTALATLSTLPNFGPNTYVFSTTEGERPSSNFCKVKRELDRLSETSGWTIHDLRRTVRSKLAELRVPEVVARKVLNHELGKVDRTYNRHDYMAEKRTALRAWEANLLNLIARRR
jgi:integrase